LSWDAMQHAAAAPVGEAGWPGSMRLRGRFDLSAPDTCWAPALQEVRS